MDTVVSTIVSSQTSITISSQTIAVAVSKSVVSTGVTVVTSIEDSGISFSFGITAFTGSTRNGNISSVNTWGSFYSSSDGGGCGDGGCSDRTIRVTVVSGIGTVVSKTVSGVSSIVSSTVTISSQTISVAVMAQ